MSEISIYQTVHFSTTNEIIFTKQYSFHHGDNLHTFTKAALTLNDLYDTTCMIQLVWMYKIANLYKLDVQILVWYNFWKIGWVLVSRFAMLNYFEEKSSLMNGA